MRTIYLRVSVHACQTFWVSVRIARMGSVNDCCIVKFQWVHQVGRLLECVAVSARDYLILYTCSHWIQIPFEAFSRLVDCIVWVYVLESNLAHSNRLGLAGCRSKNCAIMYSIEISEFGIKWAQDPALSTASRSVYVSVCEYADTNCARTKAN